MRGSARFRLFMVPVAFFLALAATEGPQSLRALEPLPARTLTLPVYRAATPLPTLSVNRDPFSNSPAAGGRTVSSDARLAQISDAVPVGGASMRASTADDTLPILPANDGAFGAALPAGYQPQPASAVSASSVTLLGVSIGARSYALVSDGGAAKILGIGDRVGDRTIRSIALDGVRIDGGDTLRLAGMR